MKYINRNRSTITGKKNLEHLHTLKNFPVFIGSTDQPPEKDLTADLSFSICKDTGIVQLDKVLPLDVVYSGYHSEAIGGIWNKHHQSFLTFISRYPFKKVLEIGGSNGRLASAYLSKHSDTDWTTIEPNPGTLPDKRIHIIPQVFDDSFSTITHFDTIIHSHTLEHIYQPRNFLNKVASLLKSGQYHIFSVPNLFSYLKNHFTNVLNFEHTIFLTEYFIDYLLNLSGFKVIDKKYFGQHSIFYITKKVSETSTMSFRSHYQIYKKLFKNYFDYNKKIIDRYNKMIDRYGGKIYLFGAHVFSQYLLNQGLKTPRRLISILDNSLLKQGKRLYGTNLMINCPEIIRNEHQVAVILNAGAYQREIKKQLQEINRQVSIWE